MNRTYSDSTIRPGPPVGASTIRVTPPDCTCTFGTLTTHTNLDEGPPRTISVVVECRPCRVRAAKYKVEMGPLRQRPRPPAPRLDGRRRRR